jgi:hypothetical protein
MYASDVEMPPTDELEAHLQCQLTGRVRNLRVLRRDAGLILQGHAPTYYAKQLAQQALMKATSVPLVANEIVVV